MDKPVTLQEHLRQAAKMRWANKSKEERSAHMKAMVRKRWDKKKP